jgi:hypothetical protein
MRFTLTNSFTHKKHRRFCKGQGKDNEVLIGHLNAVDPNSPITVTHRIGGLLAYYHRQSQVQSNASEKSHRNLAH